MIEEPLYEYLCGSEQLKPLLAVHDGDPAVFQQIAPTDTDECWEGMQFPRIVFDIDKSGDVERKISGILAMDIMCSDQSGSSPEDIEKVLKELIDGYFFVVEGLTYAAKWERSDSFTTEPNNKVYGLTVTFSLLAFPRQIAGYPDTVELMNTWSTAFFPNATIINITATQKVFKPTDEAPVIYWSFRNASESPLPSTYHCTWIQNNLSMHVIAPTETVRSSLVIQAMHELSLKRRLLFPDRSQFMLHSTAANMSADPIRVGQLTVVGSYGLLPENLAASVLNNINISQK